LNYLPVCFLVFVTSVVFILVIVVEALMMSSSFRDAHFVARPKLVGGNKGKSHVKQIWREEGRSRERNQLRK